jgi:hypothetical protein
VHFCMCGDVPSGSQARAFLKILGFIKFDLGILKVPLLRSGVFRGILRREV